MSRALIHQVPGNYLLELLERCDNGVLDGKTVLEPAPHWMPLRKLSHKLAG